MARNNYDWGGHGMILVWAMEADTEVTGKKPMKNKDITGKRFGRLVAQMEKNRSNDNREMWLFKCDCGNEKIIRKKDVLSRKSKSCGCLHKEIVTTHGMHQTRFYKIWHAMKERCDNPNNKFYSDYGGRNIVYQKTWVKFENFRDDMIESYLNHCEEFGIKETSIDRINVDGNYTKNNTRWATSREQQRNRRDNIYLELDDKPISLYELVEKTGIHKDTLIGRYNRGWRDKKLLQPVKQNA